MGGFEENLDVIVNNKVIKGNPESDVERTTAERKQSTTIDSTTMHRRV